MKSSRHYTAKLVQFENPMISKIIENSRESTIYITFTNGVQNKMFLLRKALIKIKKASKNSLIFLTT